MISWFRNYAARVLTPKRNPYQEITMQILEYLEQGVRSWTLPWSGGAVVVRPLRHSGVAFTGVNVLRLWVAGQQAGYTSPYWLTLNQARQLGGCVRKGSNSTFAVRIQEYFREDENRSICYPVFNADQIEGLPDSYYAAPALSAEHPGADGGFARIDAVEAFIAATGADIRYAGDDAWYDPGEDRIQIPVTDLFVDIGAFYSTLCHELIHWTRHEARLARSFGHEKFGDAGYAMEELVAEMGAAFLCADLGISHDVREDHASYIAGWLKVLRDDHNAVFVAASHAQRAAGWLHALGDGQFGASGKGRSSQPTTRRAARSRRESVEQEQDDRRVRGVASDR